MKSWYYVMAVASVAALTFSAACGPKSDPGETARDAGEEKAAETAEADGPEVWFSPESDDPRYPRNPNTKQVSVDELLAPCNGGRRAENVVVFTADLYGRINGPRLALASVDGKYWADLDVKGRRPVFSPDGSKIAFISKDRYFRNGNVFLVDVDGQNLKQLTKYGDDPAEIIDDADSRIGVLDHGLTFSPDGRRILYCSEEFGSRDIFAVNADGTGKTRLTDFADCGESRPVFLAGGDKVLFEVTRDRVRNEIWIMNADGSGKKKAPVPDDTRLVAISPDGKKMIAFGEYPGEGNRVGLFTRVPYVAALNGSSRFMLGEGDDWPLNGFSGSFSPDGKKVLHSTHDGIWIIDADGRGRKNLTPVCYRASAPAFFADGAKIAFVNTRPWSPYCDDIWTMDADGSNLKLFKATESMDVRDFVVSPTGDRFLIQGDNCGEVTPGYFVVNADGSGLARLTKKGRFPDD